MKRNERQGEELPREQIKLFLQANQLIDSAKSELDVYQYFNGFSNLTYLLEIEDQAFVLRKPPTGAIKRGHDMGREFKVLSSLHKAFPKAPQALAFADAGTVTEASFYIMERVEGIILTTKEALSRNIPPASFKTIANSWMDTFVELHQVDYKAIGLEDLGKPEGYIDRQVTNWGKQYLKAATREIPEAHKVMEWMQNNQPKTYDYSLIHNDYKYDNIVFADDNWQDVSAVLDWEMCTLGDPLMDLGTSIAYWSMATDGEMILKGFPSPTALEGNPGRHELVEMYASKSGRPVDNLVFYYVYGLFKISVIVQQIFYRYQKGLTTDKRFAKLDEATVLFCKMAWAAVQKNRIERLFGA